MDLIAGQFNGGGHACAAGLNLKQDTANFYARLVAAITRQMAVVDKQNQARA
jgi:phosphoesterase RecJ-like protein